jgi:hypothetical protein
MARPSKRVHAEVPLAAYSICQFCAAHSISESFYYRLRTLGKGPVEIRVADKVTISVESAEAWRRQHEQVTATEPAA